MAKAIEFVPFEEAVLVVVTRDSGDIHTFEMSWKEFNKLQAEVVRTEGGRSK